MAKNCLKALNVLFCLFPDSESIIFHIYSMKLFVIISLKQYYSEIFVEFLLLYLFVFFGLEIDYSTDRHQTHDLLASPF